MNRKSRKSKSLLFSSSLILGFIIPTILYAFNKCPFGSFDNCMFLLAFIALGIAALSEFLEWGLNFVTDKHGEIDFLSLFIVFWSIAYLLIYGISNEDLRPSFEIFWPITWIFIVLVPFLWSIGPKKGYFIYSRTKKLFKIFPTATTGIAWVLAWVLGREIYIYPIYLPLIWVSISTGIFILKIIWYSHKDTKVGKMYEMLGALFKDKDSEKTNGRHVKVCTHDFFVLIGKYGLISRWWALEVEKGEDKKRKLTKKNKKITMKLIRRDESYQICVSDIGQDLCYKIKNN